VGDLIDPYFFGCSGQINPYFEMSAMATENHKPNKKKGKTRNNNNNIVTIQSLLLLLVISCLPLPFLSANGNQNNNNNNNNNNKNNSSVPIRENTLKLVHFDVNKRKGP